jgi:hypothetical protein
MPQLPGEQDNRGCGSTFYNHLHFRNNERHRRCSDSASSYARSRAGSARAGDEGEQLYPTVGVGVWVGEPTADLLSRWISAYCGYSGVYKSVVGCLVCTHQMRVPQETADVPPASARRTAH